MLKKNKQKLNKISTNHLKKKKKLATFSNVLLNINQRRRVALLYVGYGVFETKASQKTRQEGIWKSQVNFDTKIEISKVYKCQ